MATIHIEGAKSNYSKKSCKIQSIPCKIYADCDANVSKYFDNYVKPNEDGTLKASFRGYPLQGKKIELPDEYVGLVLHESVRPETEKDERKFYIVNKFADITYWNWERKPSKHDAFIKALDWIDIADELHRPVTEESPEETMKENIPSTPNKS